MPQKTTKLAVCIDISRPEQPNLIAMTLNKVYFVNIIPDVDFYYDLINDDGIDVRLLKTRFKIIDSKAATLLYGPNNA